jgi:hypothetical protein
MLRRFMMMTVMAVLGLTVSVGPVRAEFIIALTTQNALLTFDSNTPGTVTSPIAITGLQASESILGIDVRPRTGRLVGLGSTSRVYVIDPFTGVATEVRNLAPTALSGTAFGFDFNPVPDALRIISDADQNLRITAGGTGVVNTDTNLIYAAGDPNAAANPNVVGSAYTNNFDGTTTTTLYGIDSNLDILVRQGGVNVPPGTPSPNTGQLFTVGSLGVNTSDLVGFDVSGFSGTAFAALTAPGGASSQFYTLNLSTGAATLAGTVGGGQTIRGIAVATVPEPSSLTLIVISIVGLMGYGWQRRKRTV